LAASQDQELNRHLTHAESKRLQEGKACREAIAEERFWNKGPDGIAQQRTRERKKKQSHKTTRSERP
jgi:hypothetical protein